MKKRFLIISLLFLLCIGILSAQEEAEELGLLSSFGNQFSFLFEGIGQDLLPAMQQTVMAGDIMGSAEINKLFFPFYISLPGVGVTFFDGLVTNLDDKRAYIPPPVEALTPELEDTYYEDKENDPLLVPNLVDTALSMSEEEGEEDKVSRYVDYVQQVFLLPTFRLGFGFTLPWNLEFHFSGMYIPDSILSTIMGFAGQDSLADVVTTDFLDIGFKVRKVLINDKGLLRPAFSVGVGYYRSAIDIGFELESLADLGMEDLEEGIEMEALGNLDFEGSLGISSTVNSFGMDFHVSKNLFLFTPFLKFSPYFYTANFNTEADMVANILDEFGEPDIESPFVAGSDETLAGISLFTTAGLEINLLTFILHISATADVQYPVFELGEIGKLFEAELDELYLDKVSLSIGMRLQL